MHFVTIVHTVGLYTHFYIYIMGNTKDVQVSN